MGDLSAVEKELAEAVAAGKPLDLSRRAERVVRAEVIRDLVRGADADRLGVGLRGARVVGELDLELVKAEVPLLLDNCVFDERPTMFGAEIPALSLDGSTLPGLYAEGLRTNYFTMTNARLTGTLDLDDARVDGQLRLSGTSLRTGDDVALRGDGLRVARVCWLDDVFAESHGDSSALLLNRCDIGSDLVLSGTVVTNTAGGAVELDYAAITGSLLAGQALCHAEGAGDALSINSARIDGQVFLGGSVLRATEGRALSANTARIGSVMFLVDEFDAASSSGDCAVHLVGAELLALQVSDATIRGRGGPAITLSKSKLAGSVDLESSRLEADTGDFACGLSHVDIGGQLVLDDTEFVNRGDGLHLDLSHARIGQSFLFPAEELTSEVDFGVSLHGLTYPEPPIGDGDWLKLLREHTVDYEAQPYQQLAKVHRATGHEHLARKILIAQQNDLRRRGDLGGWWARRWHWFLGKTLGYGYQPSRAVAGLVATFAASVALVIAASWTGGTVPAKDRPETACTLVNRINLAADLSIPLVKLGGQPKCEFSGSAQGQWYTAGGWVIQLLGWSFATLSVAGFTGLVRKN